MIKLDNLKTVKKIAQISHHYHVKMWIARFVYRDVRTNFLDKGGRFEIKMESTAPICQFRKISSLSTEC